MAKKVKKQINIKSLIVAFFLAALVLFYFNHLSNKSAKRQEKQLKAEVTELINYDIMADYPKTPRELAKLHNRFYKVFYSIELSDKELNELNQRVRKLYSEELLELNPEGNSLAALQKNIDEADDEGYEYKSFELPQPSQIEEFTKDGRDYASLEVKMTVVCGKKMGYKYVRYIMVKQDDRWKIYGWGNTEMGE